MLLPAVLSWSVDFLVSLQPSAPCSHLEDFVEDNIPGELPAIFK